MPSDLDATIYHRLVIDPPPHSSLLACLFPSPDPRKDIDQQEYILLRCIFHSVFVRCRIPAARAYNYRYNYR